MIKPPQRNGPQYHLKTAQVNKKKSNLSKTTITNQYTVIANKFTPLNNLRENNAESNKLQTLHEQRKRTNQTSTQIIDATPNQYKKGMKIPTIINGRLTCDDDRKPTTRKKEDARSPN